MAGIVRLSHLPIFFQKKIFLSNENVHQFVPLYENIHVSWGVAWFIECFPSKPETRA